jgi:hypothetical protein
MSNPAPSETQSRRHHWALFLLWLLVSAALVKISSPQITSLSGWDPDDQLRLVQLRDFLGGQSWFDTTQYRMNTPDGAPMHWSRLIELPLALIVLVLQPLIGTAQAEMVAGIIVPLGCLGAIAYLLSGVALKIGGQAAGISAFLLTLMSPALLIQLRPMRIDHHGWQIFCAAFALATLFWSNPRKAGLALGVALAVWVHISLEGAPMTAAFFLLLGWRWIVDRNESTRLFWTLAGFAGVSLLLFFGTQSAGLAAAQYCDTVSPGHLWAILMAVGVVAPAAHYNPDRRMVRGALAVTGGIAALAILLWLAPQCRDGAFGGLDPIIREYWYAKISEGLPVWYQDVPTAITLMAPLIVALAALAISWRISDAQHRPMLTIVGFFLTYASLLSVLVFRTISVATLFTIIPIALCLAAALQRYLKEPVLARRLLLVIASLFLLTSGMVSGAVAAAFETKPEKSESKRIAAADKCESIESVQALAKLPKGNIIAPFDIGPAILVSTQHSVLASSHHRNVRGMRDQIDIFRLPPAEARKLINRHQISYIVACDAEAEMAYYAERNPAGLWASISKGAEPDWLNYHGTLGKGLRVWAVRR